MEISLLVSGTIVLFLIGHAVTVRETGPVWPIVSAAIFLLVLLLQKLTTGTTIELDRREGMVKKTESSPFFRKQRTYSLLGVESVRLTEENRTVEEGYVITRYSIVLRGRDGARVLFSTNDKQKARSLYCELLDYLDLPEIPAA